MAGGYDCCSTLINDWNFSTKEKKIIWMSFFFWQGRKKGTQFCIINKCFLEINNYGETIKLCSGGTVHLPLTYNHSYIPAAQWIQGEKDIF